MNREEHWDRAYRDRPATELSWYRPALDTSLELIRQVSEPSSRVIDVGAGAATLVDDLLDLGYSRLTVLDVSREALARTQARLGPRGARINWILGDVTQVRLPPAACDVWHDRAAFHFLTDERDRRAYADIAARALSPGGHIVIATFAPDGPERCSGLPVCRHSGQSIALEFGSAFELVEERRETHLTPAGREQKFMYALLRRRDAAS
jgi:SAM-dependent methyltransferase